MLKKVATFTLAVPLMAGGLCFAEDKVVTKTETVRTAEAAAPVNHARISKYIGKDVHNAAGKDIGDIKDVVLDGNGNRVAYAVVSYGGFMGMGDKLFAVPWSAFEFRFDANEDLTKERNRDDYKLFLRVSDENLKGAPGFDEKNWPQMADPKWRSEVDAYYTGKGVNMQMNQMPDKMQGVGDGGVIDRNAEKMAKTAPSDSKGLMWVRRASKVIGADVHNKANEDVGDIHDLVADTATGKINYAVLSYGGVMGIGDKLFAVPMESLATKADDDKFVLDVTKDRLKTAPGFDKSNWPDFAGADFRKGVDDFYRSKQTEAKTPMD